MMIATRPTRGLRLSLTSVVVSVVVLAMLSVQAAADEEQIKRGEYLTTILGCAGCHTEGALLGDATGPWLAGSNIGVGYAEDEEGNVSSVVFPANLTPDTETGLGDWSINEIVRAITLGVKHTGDIVVPVMPWPNYAMLDRKDALDIAHYLKSLLPVKREIPQRIQPGEPIDKAYVRVGVYLFQPDDPDGDVNRSEIGAKIIDAEQAED